ncbi:MAG: uridine kinase family protein [Acidimicrobiales bacterium]
MAPQRVRPDEVATRIEALRLAKTGTLLVAIDGCGGAGKSSLAAGIADRRSDVTVVHLDDFARPSVAGWDWGRFAREVLVPILADRPGRFQRWDWSTDSGAEWHEVPVGGVVLAEGVGATRMELGASWDLTIWVSAPPELRLARGIARDGKEQLAQWVEAWMPEEDSYVATQHPDERADLIVDGSQK